jgi:hypothetical protein
MDPDVLFEGVKQMLEHVAAPLRQRLGALEAEVSSIRQLGYAGVHQRALANSYRRGVLVTFDGALWCSLKDAPQGTPGSSADWQLCVKAAR